MYLQGYVLWSSIHCDCRTNKRGKQVGHVFISPVNHMSSHYWQLIILCFYCMFLWINFYSFNISGVDPKKLQTSALLRRKQAGLPLTPDEGAPLIQRGSQVWQGMPKNMLVVGDRPSRPLLTAAVTTRSTTLAHKSTVDCRDESFQVSLFYWIPLSILKEIQNYGKGKWHPFQYIHPPPCLHLANCVPQWFTYTIAKKILSLTSFAEPLTPTHAQIPGKFYLVHNMTGFNLKTFLFIWESCQCTTPVSGVSIKLMSVLKWKLLAFLWLFHSSVSSILR